MRTQAVATVIILLSLALASSAGAAPAGAATSLAFGNEACQANGTVSGRLSWTPSGVGGQYVDLGLDAGFARFNSGGPFAASASSIELSALTPGSTYFARVRTVSGGQTLTSDVLPITAPTCGSTTQAQPVQAQFAGTFQLSSVYNGKCLEIYGFSQANFGTANQWACWGGPNQTVQATRLADGYYELRFVHSGKCLEVMNWSRANGAPIGQYDCHGGDNQRWSATIANGSVSLVWSKFSGKCLDIYGWALHDGAALVQWDCHGGANQQWRSGTRDGSSGTGPRIAITIDTDSIRGYMPQVLDVLDAHGVKASFGVTGQWAVNNPDLVWRMAVSGHTIMNHSWSHPSFPSISSAARQDEIRRTDEAIQHIAGVTTRPYFRPPYGATNSAVSADAAAVGHRVILWNVDPQGWRGYSGETITNHILSHAFDGAVVLMHSTNAGDLAALGPSIQGLKNRGYRFVTIAQMYP